MYFMHSKWHCHLLCFMHQMYVLPQHAFFWHELYYVHKCTLQHYMKSDTFFCHEITLYYIMNMNFGISILQLQLNWHHFITICITITSLHLTGDVMALNQHFMHFCDFQATFNLRDTSHDMPESAVCAWNRISWFLTSSLYHEK